MVARLPTTIIPKPFPDPNKRNDLTPTPDEFYVISMVTRLSSKCRLGITSMLAMLYLTLFADGVTEETSPTGEEFGEHRLTELLLRDPRGDAGAMVNGINRAVTAWAAGAPAADDITVLVVRRTQ